MSLLQRVTADADLRERGFREKAASEKDVDIQERFSVHLHIFGEGKAETSVV